MIWALLMGVVAAALSAFRIGFTFSMIRTFSFCSGVVTISSSISTEERPAALTWTPICLTGAKPSILMPTS